MFNGVEVDRLKIKSYFTEYYFSAMELFNRWRRFGMPFTGGWAEQPDYIVRIIELFDRTMTEWGNRSKHGHS